MYENNLPIGVVEILELVLVPLMNLLEENVGVKLFSKISSILKQGSVASFVMSERMVASSVGAAAMAVMAPVENISC
jgi:hypothetical protein